MKTFEKPEIQIIKFNLEDILTTSGDMTPILPIGDVSGISEDECAKISIGD